MEQPQEAPPPRKPWLKWVGFIIGAALLAAAIHAVWGQRTALSEALEHAASTRWWLIALALSLPLLNWLITSVIFFVLMHPAQAHATARRVPFREMLWLIGSSWLFNYLPASPGLFGRVAYHQRVHGIAWKHSARAVITAMFISAAALAFVVGLNLLPGVTRPGMLVAPIILAVVFLAYGLIDYRRKKDRWYFPVALGLRCLDLIVWAARYRVIMLILNIDATMSSAVGMAIVSQAAMLIPFLGNGLGVREWAVGLIGPVLPSWYRTATGVARGAALSVDLVNRACEVVVAIPVGLLSTALLARHATTTPANGPLTNTVSRTSDSSRSEGAPTS